MSLNKIKSLNMETERDRLCEQFEKLVQSFDPADENRLETLVSIEKNLVALRDFAKFKNFKNVSKYLDQVTVNIEDEIFRDLE